MAEGKILKGIGGFYYVRTEAGTVECKARGKFRNKSLSPCVGDNVSVTLADFKSGSIDKIYDRKNCFVRPPVANIDIMVIVSSVQNPSPDLVFIDKMLVLAEKSGVEVMVVFNKSDLDDGSVNELVRLYRDAGYRAITVSTVENVGIDIVRSAISGKTGVFAGFSGVGKSSLLNAVMNERVMETGEISMRLKRGRHTTRHVELVEYGGGYVVDTPGFSMLSLPDNIGADELRDFFPDFAPYSDGCRFRGCNHMGNSSVCAVCEAAEKGQIAKSRFENYKSFFDIISKRKEW